MEILHSRRKIEDLSCSLLSPLFLRTALSLISTDEMEGFEDAIEETDQPINPFLRIRDEDSDIQGPRHFLLFPILDLKSL